MRPRHQGQPGDQGDRRDHRGTHHGAADPGPSAVPEEPGQGGEAEGRPRDHRRQTDQRRPLHGGVTGGRNPSVGRRGDRVPVLGGLGEPGSGHHDHGPGAQHQQGAGPDALRRSTSRRQRRPAQSFEGSAPDQREPDSERQPSVAVGVLQQRGELVAVPGAPRGGIPTEQRPESGGRAHAVHPGRRAPRRGGRPDGSVIPSRVAPTSASAAMSRTASVRAACPEAVIR